MIGGRVAMEAMECGASENNLAEFDSFWNRGAGHSSSQNSVAGDTVVFIYNGQRISKSHGGRLRCFRDGSVGGCCFTLLAGSQQPLGVMRTNFTHVGAMGHV
jgi:hypothetical protein